MEKKLIVVIENAQKSENDLKGKISELEKDKMDISEEVETLKK